MKTYAIRFKPGQDLKVELDNFVQENNINAGFIITCAGSLKRAVIRVNNADGEEFIEETMEILSLTGTLSKDGSHLHITLADKNGISVGGHIKKGCEVLTTAEIVVGACEDLTFKRELDPETGYKELIISDSGFH